MDGWMDGCIHSNLSKVGLTVFKFGIHVAYRGRTSRKQDGYCALNGSGEGGYLTLRM